MTHCYRYKLMIKPAQVLAPTRSWPSGMLQKPCWPCLATTNPLPSLPNLPSSRPAIRRSVLLQWYSLSLNGDYCTIIRIYEGSFFVDFSGGSQSSSLTNLPPLWIMKHRINLIKKINKIMSPWTGDKWIIHENLPAWFWWFHSI